MTCRPAFKGKAGSVCAVRGFMTVAVIILLIVALSGALLAAVNHARLPR
jgi:hypothetical protein